MKLRKLMIPVVGAAMFTLIGPAGPAGAADPPGRGASTGGLGNALVNVAASGADVVPTDQISLNIVMAQDPAAPGVSPGGGGVEP